MNDELPGALVILALGLLTAGFFGRHSWIMRRDHGPLSLRIGRIAAVTMGLVAGILLALFGTFYLNLIIFGTDL